MGIDLNSPFILPKFGEFLPARIIPGPMEGVTEGIFLKVLTSRKWVKCWWTPFLRISVAVPHRPRLRHWMADYLGTGLPVIAQVMGTDSARLAKAGQGLREQGARAIDLNCACPSQIVVSNGAGGARLRNPSWIAETVVQMKAALDCPVGVKVRTGFESPGEFANAIAPALREAKPDFVTVHFRTVREGYSRVSDGLERLAEARRQLPDIPLVGSGDLFTVEDIARMRDLCGVDAVAPARGLLRNPRLIDDASEFLKNGAIREWNDGERHALVHEFKEHGASLGFLLQMAANIFGRDSMEFRELVDRYTHSKNKSHD